MLVLHSTMFYVYVYLYCCDENNEILLLSNLFAKNEILARKKELSLKIFSRISYLFVNTPHLQTHIMTLTRIFWCTQYNNKVL